MFKETCAILLVVKGHLKIIFSLDNMKWVINIEQSENRKNVKKKIKIIPNATTQRIIVNFLVQVFQIFLSLYTCAYTHIFNIIFIVLYW